MGTSDAVLAALFACAAGFSLASVTATQHRALPVEYTPPPVMSYSPVTETFVPFDPITEQQRLDTAQENIEMQSARIKTLDEKLDILLRQDGRDAAGDGSRAEPRSQR